MSETICKNLKSLGWKLAVAFENVVVSWTHCALVGALRDQIELAVDGHESLVS